MHLFHGGTCSGCLLMAHSQLAKRTYCFCSKISSWLIKWLMRVSQYLKYVFVNLVQVYVSLFLYLYLFQCWSYVYSNLIRFNYWHWVILCMHAVISTHFCSFIYVIYLSVYQELEITPIHSWMTFFLENKCSLPLRWLYPMPWLYCTCIGSCDCVSFGWRWHRVEDRHADRPKRP